MRSERNTKQIIGVMFNLLSILLLCNVSFAVANPIEDELHHNQVKRSPNGYFSSQSNDVEAQGGLNLEDRLRRELNRASYSSSNSANGVTCSTECRLMPGHSDRTQAELDALAQEMTNQILLDLRSGKLHRGQINSPNWFENRVADRLSDFQQNQQFSIQTQQQQQQHQSSQFQQQSQSQQTYGYSQPIGGSSYQRVVEEHHKQRNDDAAFPPIKVYHGPTIIRNNCTDQIQTNSYPFFNVQNQFNQRVESDRQITNTPTFITPVVSGGDSSYHVSQSYQRNEQHIPHVSVVIPARNSYTREYKEVQHEIQQHHQPRPIYTVNQQNHASSHVESSKVHNVQIITPAPVPVITRQDIIDHFYESEVVPNYKPRVTIDQNSKFHELEVHNRQHYQPIQPVTSRSHFQTEEQHIDQEFHQNPIVVQPQVSNQVTREEFEMSHQVTQKPYIYPQQNIVTQTQNEEIQQTIQKTRPQVPIITHVSNVQSINENHQIEQHNTQMIQQPSGQTVTTIKETHFVNILPQPANQYVTEYNQDEYNERLNSIEQELQRLGYGYLTQEEYNATISSGGFIHNGYKYVYNPDVHRYEKTDRIEINEEEYHSLLHGLQNELRQLGTQMTESQYNQTINDGYFIVNGNRYVYDSESGTYHRQEMSNNQYELLRQNIQHESDRYGWGLTINEINQTIATGNLIINGHQYTLDKQTGVLIEGQDIEISEQEYRTILRRLQEQLYQLGFEQMTEREYNQTIKTGFFVRNGQKYQYNADIGRYDKVELSEDEYYSIVRKLKETLQRLNYRQMSEYETNQTIASGSFKRGGYQWTYNSETGEATAVRNTQPFEELSQAEYESIKRRLQTLLRSLGYPEMSLTEVETTVITGKFLRGGNHWVYQPATGEFIRIELSEQEYNHRLDRLNEILNRLGIQKSESEMKDIIYRGCFYFGGYRYEYDVNSGSFVQVHMTDEEYEQRKRQLLQQLREIGYGTMTDSECRITIKSGVFYYGGHEWIYNYQSGKYEMGKISDKENGIVDDNFFTNIGYDSTHYETSANDTETENGVGNIQSTLRPKEIISKDRGDQPPQTFEDDYDDEVPKKPIKIPTQATPQRPAFTTPVPAIMVSTVSSMNSHYEQQRQVNYVVPQPETQIEQRYHHKKTSYSQTYVPYNQGVLSRARKSGSTGIETELNDNGKHEKKQENFVRDETEQKEDKIPMELDIEEIPTKTRFTGRKSFADMFDSTTQLIDTKTLKESSPGFWSRLKEKASNWMN